jgi:hypothetical protein
MDYLFFLVISKTSKEAVSLLQGRLLLFYNGFVDRLEPCSPLLGS